VEASLGLAIVSVPDSDKLLACILTTCELYHRVCSNTVLPV